MSEIDQQFIEYVVKSLVGNPDVVHIDRRIDEKGVLLELTVDPEDLGRVIGKRGATAQSLRTLLRALGTKNDARYNLKIIDNGIGSDARDTSNEANAGPKSQHSDDAVASSPPMPKEDKADETTVQTESEPESVVAKESDPAKDETSDRLRQTRAELADLDDLDV